LLDYFNRIQMRTASINHDLFAVAMFGLLTRRVGR
jgi:hypothetical protein